MRLNGTRWRGRPRGLTTAALLTVAVLLGAAALLSGAAGGCAPSRPADRPGTPASARAPTATGVPAPTSTAAGSPARFAPQVRRYAGQAGIDAQLLMAILYNEAYKPHDPDLERAWQKIDPNAALGVANMHRAAFDDTKRGRDFANRDWQELPDDPNLAIEAAAWYLHDLAAQLPANWPAKYTKDELLALGYNAGPGSMKGYAQGGRPNAGAQSYLDELHANWDAAAQALR
jgi:Transglycosylase SLT domain